MDIIQKIEKEQMKKNVTSFDPGDTVKVHTRVVEGGKERIQIFAGIVIAQRGTGVNASFTVRKISNGEGVERVFPVHSPKVARIEVTKKGKVRRAKLHYLRDRLGKQATNVRLAAVQPSKKAGKDTEAEPEEEATPEEPAAAVPVEESAPEEAPAAEAEESAPEESAPAAESAEEAPAEGEEKPAE